MEQRVLSHSTIIRSISLQDLLNELNIFIRGALKLERCNPLDLTKTSLRLLKNLPSSRTAIFEYFSNVFIETSSNYIKAVENEINTGELLSIPETDETVLSEIHSVLIALIADNATAWAPIISKWSLDLLGEISTKFAGRAHTSINLNETLQLWMNCRSTKILVDINTKCLSSLMHSDTETCISALLDTSTKHSPNFDWVVAHVGSCFSNIVITRVLSCGLKDFCQIKSYEQGSNSPKLRSVVGILGHLAGSHSNDIRSAILEMFNWSIQQNPQDADMVKLQKKSTVPFILQLSFLSSTFFSSICKDIKHYLNVDVIVRLYHQIDDWCRYFGSPEILEDLVINLILSCDIDGNQLINLLLDCVLIEHCDNDIIKQIIGEKSLEILQNVIFKIDEGTRSDKPINLMKSLLKNLNNLHANLIDLNTIRSQTSAQILIYLCYKNQSTFIKTLKYLFQNATTVDQLSLLLKIISHELIDKNVWPYSEKGGHFAIVLEQIFSRNIHTNCDLSLTWCNLLTLLKWEKTGEIPILNSKIISKAIQSNLLNLTILFDNETNDNKHIIIEILDNLLVPTVMKFDNLQIDVILNLTQTIINYFFIICHTESGTSKKIYGLKRTNTILRRLCTYSKVAKILALREFLERALFRHDNILFGALNTTIFDSNSEKLLLKQNKKINKTIPLTKHSSVFNGGIIGSGKRKSFSFNQLSNDTISNNISELINVIKACCSLSDEDNNNNNENRYINISLDSVTLVSLLLVQFVSPDVMYNGLPWPDEEFSKVTIERDLYIRKLFTNTPVLWDLLNFIAIYRPALCYCSVLIRALTATLIHQWKSTGEQTQSQITDNYRILMDTTVRVIDVMALGQLLPPPLANIRDILPHLKCFEIVAILKDCIWCYMRDHIPSPALFTCDSNGVHWRDPTLTRPSEIYTNTLRIIMQRNIERLGPMYSQMFINVSRNE